MEIHFQFEKALGDMVQNARPFRARARVAWVGARFSDGSECTEEKARALADSVNAEKFAPPLLIDHDWSADEIKGRMVALNLDEEGNLVADFDIMDEETISKLMSGEWGDVSLTFDAGKMEVQECSIVAIPYIKGARFELPRVEESEGAETMPERVEVIDETSVAENGVMPEKEEKREEWMPGDKDETAKENPEDWADKKRAEKPEAEKPAPAEKAEDREARKNGCRENRCGTRSKDVTNEMQASKNIVANAMVENARLKSEVETLRLTVNSLREALANQERNSLVSGIIRTWVENRYIMPCEAEFEAQFLTQLHRQDVSLFDSYCKNKASVRAVDSGRRMSAAVTKAIPIEEQRTRDQAEYWKSLKQNEH